MYTLKNKVQSYSLSFFFGKLGREDYLVSVDEAQLDNQRGNVIGAVIVRKYRPVLNKADVFSDRSEQHK